MSTLREMINETVESAMIDGYHSMSPQSKSWQTEKSQHTNAAIAAFTTALLSDTAVTAVADFLRSNKTEMKLLMLAVANGEADRASMAQDVLAYTIQDWLTAALAAVTEGGQGDE